jgi:hypothetical protein
MPRRSFAHALAELSRNSRDLDVLLPGSRNSRDLDVLLPGSRNSRDLNVLLPGSRNHFQGLRDGSVDESLSLQDPGASNGIH